MSPTTVDQRTGEVISPVASFINVTGFLNHGQTQNELDAALTQLAESVRVTGKLGTLTYKLTLKPLTPGGDSEGVTITDRIVLSLPEPERVPAMMFTGDGGCLLRNRPKQETLDFAPPPEKSS